MQTASEDRSFPTSKDEATRTGRTYFQKETGCPTCGQRFHWVNGACMRCNPDYSEALV